MTSLLESRQLQNDDDIEQQLGDAVDYGSFNVVTNEHEQNNNSHREEQESIPTFHVTPILGWVGLLALGIFALMGFQSLQVHKVYLLNFLSLSRRPLTWH